MNKREFSFRELLEVRSEYNKVFRDYVEAKATKGHSNGRTLYTEFLLIDLMVILGKLNDARKAYYACITKNPVEDINLDSELLNFRILWVGYEKKIRDKQAKGDLFH